MAYAKYFPIPPQSVVLCNFRRSSREDELVHMVDSAAEACTVVGRIIAELCGAAQSTVP